MTFSIIALDADTGEFGIAAATGAEAVGRHVPFARADAGAIANQGFLNPSIGPRGLALLRAGHDAGEVVRRVTAADANREIRQLHALDRAGRSAAFTGAATLPWSGHAIRNGFSVAGNFLAGPAVLEDVIGAFEARPELPLARRLLVALKAGQAAGGDRRGTRSASIMVQGAEPNPRLDLQVEAHTDPLAELERLLEVERPMRVLAQVETEVRA